jgi:uncharacterized membrane protein (GlpM family)
MININFLANRVKAQSKQKANDLKMFRISSIVLAAMCLFMIATFAFKLFISLQLSGTNKKIDDYKASIVAQEKTEIAYLIFVNKIKVISEIYQKRSNKQEAMNYFALNLKDQADIIGMTYQENEGGLSLQLSSDNIFKFQAVQNILDSDVLRQQYQNIKKTGLSRGDNGGYKLTLQLQLKTQWP